MAEKLWSSLEDTPKTLFTIKNSRGYWKPSEEYIFSHLEVIIRNTSSLDESTLTFPVDPALQYCSPSATSHVKYLVPFELLFIGDKE